MRLQVENLSYNYGTKEAVKQASLHVDAGEFVGIIGPNGSGKSTVLKNIYRGLAPDQGKIFLDGEDLLSMPYRRSALKLAVVGQENEVPFDFTVEEMVAMGRSPHKKLFEIDTPKDKKIVRHALEHMGMEQMAKRSYRFLSGGEKQRVLIARAIAQESDFLILDEHTAALDPKTADLIMELTDRIVREKGLTALMVTHNLRYAAEYGDRLIMMHEGRDVLDLSGAEKERTGVELLLSKFNEISVECGN